MRRPRPISLTTLPDDPVASPDATVPPSAPAAPGGSLLRRAWLRATGQAAGPEPQPSDVAGAPPGAGPTPSPAEPDGVAVPPADVPRSRRKAR